MTTTGEGKRLDFRTRPRTDFSPVEELSRDEARREIKALRDGIEYHDHKYYVDNAPVISDRVYDELFRRLEALEKSFPDLRDPNSPTKRVGGKPMEGLEKVEHSAPMLSLNAALEQQEVEDFLTFVTRETGAAKPAFVAEPKFDGLSLEVVYEKGALARAATRGDGSTGEDVTHNARTIRSMPLHLEEPDKAPGFLAVRGEVILHKDDFQAINRRRIERGEEPFANPRNAAAGTMRRLDPKAVAESRLDITFYDVLDAEGAKPETQWNQLERMRCWGLKTDPEAERLSGFAAVRRYHQRLAEARDGLDYEIDGIVIKLDDVAAQQRLGTRHRSPRWALAWKFPPRQEVTTLRDIVVQVGMSGILTPVALLEPVDVSGVTVSRATLHNEDEVRRKDVWPGCRVRVQRAGDVIPEIVERVSGGGKRPGKRFRLPARCPACGARTVREGAYVLCPAGLVCPPQLIGHVLHYAAREAMDIEGLGEKTARKLVDRGLVRDVADLYALDRDTLEGLEGFAAISAGKLVKEIEATKTPPLDRLLFALGIRHVGQRVAQQLARRFGRLEAIKRAGADEIDAVPGIGPEIAGSVRNFFDTKENRHILDKLRRHGVSPRPFRGGDRHGPLEGKTFVFTGTLESWTRDEAQERIEALGGRATSSVSGRTDYLVVGAEPGSKLEEARAQDVTILDERAFARLVRK